MRYSVDAASRPIYLQLYKQIRDDIVKGVFQYNSKLPSKRLLAAETGVSTITVEHAYALLCDEGYAQARQRSGYFVIFRKADGFAAYDLNFKPPTVAFRPRHVYPDFSFPVLSKTMRKVLSEYGEAVLEKSHNQGNLELREAISRYLARNRGINADVEQIVIGSGSEYLYSLIIRLLGAERIYAIEAPSYRKIEQIYKASGIQYEMLPLSHDGIESCALASTIADVLHVTPYRSFPSGATASASKRHEYIMWSNMNNRYIIEDDYESEFSVSTKPTETLFALADKNNVIYLNTFSKTISPSLRIGYMVLSKALANRFSAKLGFYSCTVPTFEQLVLTELLRAGDFERHINRVRRKKRKELLDVQK